MQYLVQSMYPISVLGFVDDGGNNTDLLNFFFILHMTSIPSLLLSDIVTSY